MTGGKLALVTGAGGGIGRAIARLALAQGWRVVLIDVQQEALARTAAELGGAEHQVCDITDEAQVAALVDSLDAVPQLLVNNAGVVKFSYLLDMSVADFRRVIDIDLTGAFIMSQAVARRMREHGGSIVNISSIGGITPSLGTNAYAPGKAGLAKLSELMALEWGGYGIRVNTVSPGFIDGGMSTPVYADPKTRAVRSQAVPLKRLGSEDDIAQAVMFLASDAAGYISGHNLVVDGAITHSVLSQVPRA
jgi:NAD(P)-dependent dehydrogenase (short-subunit alcohol dehydrogenase family)